MKSKQLVCRTCGRTYDGCKSANVGVANKWKSITCSTECYKKYIDNIRKSRNIASVDDTAKVNQTSHEDIYEEVDIIDDYENEEDDEDEEELLDLFGE